jgi:hypothetical protein
VNEIRVGGREKRREMALCQEGERSGGGRLALGWKRSDGGPNDAIGGCGREKRRVGWSKRRREKRIWPEKGAISETALGSWKEKRGTRK